jgi:hypothetical protein
MHWLSMRAIGTSWLYRLLLIVEVQHCVRIVGVWLCIVDVRVLLPGIGAAWVYRPLLIVEFATLFSHRRCQVVRRGCVALLSESWYVVTVPVVVYR